jgi:hypothetical protein
MAERPRPQEIYRHFKGNVYQVLTIATHSETREEMVVYQALYGDYKVYVRPLDMFMSEVDREKYPTARQKMRFEKINPAAEPQKPAGVKGVSQVMSKSIDQEASELNMDPLVIRFLDADLAVERNEILSKLRPTITNDMIDIMAMAVGVVINEGDVYDRYSDLQNVLTTMEKYESTRLRS